VLEVCGSRKFDLEVGKVSSDNMIKFLKSAEIKIPTLKSVKSAIKIHKVFEAERSKKFNFEVRKVRNQN
jgi:hypothetical protein